MLYFPKTITLNIVHKLRQQLAVKLEVWANNVRLNQLFFYFLALVLQFHGFFHKSEYFDYNFPLVVENVAF